MDHSEYLRRRADLIATGFEENDSPMIAIDPAGTILLTSDGAGVLFGCARSDLVDNPLSQYFVPPSSVENCQQGGFCQAGQIRQLELRHSQGDIIPVEVHCFGFAAEPIKEMADPEVSTENPAGVVESPVPADPDAVAADETDRTRHCILHLADTRRREHDDELRAVRLAKLSLLNQVSEALYGAHLTLDQILQAVLICMTAGQGLRFNRAFLLLVDEQKMALQGEIAIGPSNADEATQIWRDLAGQPGDLFEMMTSYDRSIKQTDVAVNEIVRHMSVPLVDDENILIRTMHDRKAIRVEQDVRRPGTETIRHWLGCSCFAVAPLTTRRGPLGVIVADNAISGSDITDLDLEFLQMFANQSAGAIENSRLYHELEKRLLDLRKAHQKQKEDQETLLRMERLSVMGETSAIVAHELRNPLVAIGGFARTLVRGLGEEDPNREFAKIITDEVGRMERIIHDLLDFIRPPKLLRKDVILDQLVHATVSRYGTEMDAKEILLSFNLQSGETVVNCHPGEIQQVLQNYVMNAMQVLPAGGTIEVRSRLLEGGVKVEVLDNGPGFAENESDKLFSPFFSTKPTGSGLGLTICAQIIKAHGGVPGAENRERGGAKFSFILPLPKEPAVP